MILGNLHRLEVVFESEFLPTFEMDQRICVIFGFILRKSQEIPSQSEFGIQFNQLLEGRNRLGIMIGVIVQAAQIPPAFIPVGPDLHGAPIEADGIFGHASFSRRGRLLRNSLKVVCGRGTRLRQGC